MEEEVKRAAENLEELDRLKKERKNLLMKQSEVDRYQKKYFDLLEQMKKTSAGQTK